MRAPWNVEYSSAKSLNKAAFGLLVLLGLVFGLGGAARVWAKPAQVGTLAILPAASFQPNAPLAPESIATAFGAGLATTSASATTTVLPTELAGVTVEVNGVTAGLFFVSPQQLNFLLPAVLSVGPATVAVRVNNNVVARGTCQVQRAAPGIFTANANGRGVPAALLFLPQNRIEAVADCASQPCLSHPLNLCSGEAVLVLFLTGLRYAPDPNSDGNVSESLRVIVAGRELTPSFAGKQGNLAGLDQLNVLLPSALANSGLSNLVVAVRDGAGSNVVELNFAAQGGTRIERFDPLTVQVGTPLTILGAGFSATRERNIVRVLGTERQADAQVINALPGQLTVLIPFGAQSGSLSITNLDGQCGAGFSPIPLAVRTSLSGFFKDTSGNKLANVLVRVTDSRNAEREAFTNVEGAFVLAGLADGLAEVEVDGSTVQPPPPFPFPKYRFKTRVLSARDNQLEFPGSLQSLTGTPSNLTAEGRLAEGRLQLPLSALSTRTAPPIINGNVILDVPDNATIRLDGVPVSRLTLSLVGNDSTRTRALTLVGLPPRQYSSTIVQIAPLGAIISPGAKLTFPNSDGFPANAVVTLFRLDQQRGSGTLGQFIEAGPARVSADGQRIETAANAVIETTVYFVSRERPTVTVFGNVLEEDRTPVRRALLGARGRSVFTNNGDFVVSDVPVNTLPSQFADGAFIALDSAAGRALLAADPISVEASYLRPTEIVARKENNDVLPIGTVASAGVLVLERPPQDNPPVILLDPPLLRVTAGSSAELRFLVTRGSGRMVQVSVSGVAFATVRAESGDLYVLRVTPGLNDRGSYNLDITAKNDLGRVVAERLALTVQ